MNPEHAPAPRSSVDLPAARPAGLSARLWNGALQHPWWLVSALIAALCWATPAPLRRLDLLVFDTLATDLPALLRSQANGSAPPRSGSVVVAIDDATLGAIGRWPWNRRQHAQLIDRLREAGAGTIVYDVPFAEPAADAQDDEVLARALVRHHRVILPVQADVRSGQFGVGVQEPVPLLAHAAAAVAHDELSFDIDGRVRRFHLGARLGAQQWDSMPRAVWRLARGERLPELDGPLSHRDLEMAQSRAAWTLEEEALPTGSLPRPPQLSASRVLLDPRVRPLLNGQTVWVGVTASGLAEPLVSPASPQGVPGSRIAWLAQASEALARGTLERASSPGERIAAALAPLLLVLLVAPGQQRRWRGHRLLMLATVPLAVSLVGLWLSRLWLPPSAAMLGWLVGYVLCRAAHLQATRDDLQRARGHAAATLRAITDGVITVDGQHRVLYMNPVAWRFARSSAQTGAADGGGLPLGQLIRLDDSDHQRVTDAIDSSLRRRAVVRVEHPVQLRTLVGPRLVRITASPVVEAHDEHPQDAVATQPDGAVLVFNDVTDSVRAAERLQHDATHDALTGLPNRVSLARLFDDAWAAARAQGEHLALLFIDLDRLKRINDSLGHQEGDAVLQLMAQRLRHACGAGTALVRWGGDEFVALVPDRPDRRMSDAAAHAIITAVGAHLALADLQVHCSCSIGIALAPEHGDSLDTLLTHADAALRRAKLHGGGRHAHCAPAAARLADAPAWTRDALTMENRLRHALAEGALELHYQPQLDLGTAEPVGFEALLRWRQQDGALWAPGRFLDVAEESGLILDIGTWVVREATGQLARWARQGVPLVPVSVNISARQCLDRRLVQVVSDALTAHGMPASLLKLEITETTAMADIEQVTRLLHELRALGVGVAVDDFGTGYSSLAHLQRLPIDQIKIDQSFVRDIANDHQGAAIVRATIALAHELGVPVVAEGVEDETQLTFLTLHRCDIAQGFYFARPLSGVAAGEFLLARQPAASAAAQPMLALG